MSSDHRLRSGVVDVEFDGAPTRSGPLSWAQTRIHQWLDENAGLPDGQRKYLELHTPIGLDAPLSLPELVSRLRCAVARHEYLRTAMTASAGSPVQTAVPSGVVRLLASESGEDLHADLSSDPSNFPSGPLIQLGALLRGTEVHHLELRVSRLLVDGWGFANLRRSLSGELNRPVDTQATPPAFQQLDQVARETSDAWRRRSQRAVTYLGRVIEKTSAGARTSPMPLLGVSAVEAAYVSPVVSAQCDVIAERTGTSPSSVLLAAFCEAVSTRLSLAAFAVVVHCANRFEERSLTSVTRLKRETAMLFSRAGTFPESAARTYWASLEAYRNAEIDPGDEADCGLGNVIRATQAARFVYNDDRVDPTHPPGRPAAPGSGSAAADGVAPRLREAPGEPVPFLGLWVSSAGDDGRDSLLQLRTNVLPTADASSLLVDIHAILSSASAR